MSTPRTTAREVALRNRKGLAIGVSISVLVHGAGVAWALSSSTPEPRKKIQDAVPVQLVKLGKKRDPELLPRKVAEPPPPPPDTVKLDTGKEPPPPQPTKERPKNTDELSDAAKRLLERREEQLDRALERVEAEGDPSGDEAGTTTDLANAAKGYDASVARVLKSNYRLPEAIPAGQRAFLSARVVLYIDAGGNVARYEFEEQLDRALERVEAEGDPSGDEAGTTTDLANAAKGYDAAVARVLKSNYRLPEAIPAGQRAFLSARVVLYIDAGGNVARYVFEERHSNALFMGALEAMLSSLKLPPPPASERARVESDGVLVVFKP